MGVFRFPLSMPYEPRDYQSDKDAAMFNCFVEIETDTLLYQVKRPGLLLEHKLDSAGNGIFYYGDTLFIWTEDTPSLSPIRIPMSALDA